MRRMKTVKVLKPEVEVSKVNPIGSRIMSLNKITEDFRRMEVIGLNGVVVQR